MPVTKQTKLIGTHPDSSHIFWKWLVSEDKNNNWGEYHRSLTELPDNHRGEVIEWLAEKIIKHHYDDNSIERLKLKYWELWFPQYAQQMRKIPKTDTVKKGNATEIILLEYIESSLNKELTKIYRLRYNPNVDQSMKWDDVLLVDLGTSLNESKIYLGESKFRKTPDTDAINAIIDSLRDDKMPLSWTFLISNLASIDLQLANKLDDLILSDIKGRWNLVYVWMLLSNTSTSDKVEAVSFGSSSAMVFVSIGIQNPEDIISASFDKAEQLLANPTALWV